MTRLRKQASSAWLMDDDSAAATVFLTLQKQWGIGLEQMREALAMTSLHLKSPKPGCRRQKTRDFAFADAHVEADIPEWCVGIF